VRNRTQVRGELLAALKRCRVVGRLGVGLDNIDVPACEARGMKVIPATGANALSVAEYVVGSALLLLRGAYQSTAAVAAGQWPRAALSNGRECRRAHARPDRLRFDRPAHRAPGARPGHGGHRLRRHDGRGPPRLRRLGVRCAGLDEVVAGRRRGQPARAAGGLSTRGLFDAARIAAMKRGAVLVNTARGGIVDEVALAAALRSGHLGGAAIDVFDPSRCRPSPHFAGCPNLLLTPHVAGVGRSNERVSFLIADKVLEALA
jgi:(S)-sulfolactate dehydrogenase